MLSRPEVKSRFEPSGTVLVGSTPKQFAETIRKDIAKWGNVIKAAKVTAEY
jgi:tripartite-type tricarboxylate transporter receptor subunit TctC